MLFFQGATIKADEETGKILIARVMHGGAADRSGLISVGDEVVEVNGINVQNKSPADVLQILVSGPHKYSLNDSSETVCVTSLLKRHPRDAPLREFLQKLLKNC